MGLDIYVERLRDSKRLNKRGKAIYEREEVAYFRKVNCLIPFFENEMGGDVDNCKDFDISVEAMQKLVEVCDKLIQLHQQCGPVPDFTECMPSREDGESAVDFEARQADYNAKLQAYRDGLRSRKDVACAIEELPTRAGFFFGSTEYGEWYFEDLQHIKDEFSQVIADAVPSDDFVFLISY